MNSKTRSTTICCVRRDDKVAMAGDGQVTMNDVVAKSQANKVRRLEVGTGSNSNTVLVGFAGSAADAFALMERFEAKLKDSPGNVRKAAIELAKLWRTDRLLRRLEALMVVADAKCSLLISGQGDVIEPDDGVIGIGSGGSYATAAARALMKHTTLDAEKVAGEALAIAGELCVYTNAQVTVETIE